MMRVSRAGSNGRGGAAKGDVLAVAGLGILSLVFFWREIFTDRALIWGDILFAFYPAHSLWRTAILRGELPLWNPYIFTGMPLLADSQYSSLYPSMLLNLLLPLHQALAVDLTLHVFLLAAFTYAFLRRLSLSGSSAFLGAVVFAFSGYVAVRIHHVSLIRTLAWLPLLLYMVAGITPRRSTLRASLPLAAVLAAMVFAGHMQTLLISGLLAAVFGVSRVWAARSRVAERSPLVTFVAVVAVGTALTLGLAAVQILPAMELVRQSDRGGGVDYGFATSYSLPARQLPMLVSPGLFGMPTRGVYWGDWLYWEMVGYAGVASVVLAVVAIFVGQGRGRFFWLGVGIAGVLLSLGRNFIVYPLAYLFVPGLAYFRVPARFLVWYVFAVAVLAAMGLEALRLDTGHRRSWVGTFSVLAAVAVGGTYWAAGGSGVLAAVRTLAQDALASAKLLPRDVAPAVLGAVDEVARTEGRRFLLLWASAGGAVLVVRLWRRAAAVAIVGVMVLVIGDLFSFGMGFYPTVDVQELRRRPTAVDLVEAWRGTYRILTTPRFVEGILRGVMTYQSGISDPSSLAQLRNALVPNLNVQYEVLNVAGYSPIGVQSVQQVLGLAITQAARHDGRSQLLDFLGARYLFTFARLGVPFRASYAGAYYVWHNDEALPRGYLVGQYVVARGEEERARLLAGGVDLRRTVVLEEKPPFEVAPAGVVLGRIIGRSYDLNRVSFDVELTAPAILVLSDTYYPGWHVYVDGVRQPVFRANHAFRAVFLHRQARRVVFAYEPTTVKVGLWVSGVTWVGLIAAWLSRVGGRADGRDTNI
jgi:hypothetical protein